MLLLPMLGAHVMSSSSSCSMTFRIPRISDRNFGIMLSISSMAMSVCICPTP